MHTPFEKRIINLALFFLGYMVVFQVIVIFILSLRYSMYEILTTQLMTISLSTGILTAALMTWVNSKVLKHDFRELKGKWFKVLKSASIYYIVILVTNIVLSVVLSYLAGSDSVANQELIEAEMLAAPIITFITTVILAPFIEEFAFRYSLMNVTSKKKNVQILWWVISSAIFAMMHMVASLESGNLNELWFFFQYFSMGLIMGHSYLSSKNIWVPITVHLLNNGIGVLLVFFA
ncbi:MAG: CPBP family intramembrane metalloprotease [Erysipelothrix sp.]|nr:CPBP family intramembrane metalloprotease [Erysipelothrix sp.]